MRKVNGITLSVVLLSTAMGQSHRDQTARLTVADLVGRTRDAVVQLVISDEKGKQVALGSGFIVSRDGEIITNYHVIRDASSVVAELPNGSSFPVIGVLAADKDKDLAVLKVNGRNLFYLSLNETAQPRVGDHVVAIGSPLGLEGTVSDGIVSAFREDGGGKRWLQTTAPVSHGNSGGPLLNMSGSVVGVITWGVDTEAGQNLNFAVPANEVKALLASTHEPLSFSAVNNSEQHALVGQQITTGSAETASADALSKEASAAVNSGQYEKAIHDFQQVLRIKPDSAAAWHGLGVAHLYSDQYDESIAEFKEAVKREPNNGPFWRSLGLAYSIVKRYDDALSSFQSAIGNEPEYAPNWYDLGDAYDNLHNYDQAARAYQRASSLDENYADAWYKLGSVLNVLSRYDDALLALNRAVEIDPKNPDAWFCLGSTYNSLNRYQDAIAAWKKEILLKPTDGSVFGEIANAYVNLNNTKDAEDFFLRAVDAKKAAGHMTKADAAEVALYWNQLALLYDKERKHKQADYYRSAAQYLLSQY